MPHLHPALGPPADEFDLIGFEVLGFHDGGRAVVLLDAFIHDKTAGSELSGHRRTGVRRRVLDVGPVHVLPGKGEIRFDRFARVVRVADDDAADHRQPGGVELVDRRDGRVPGVSPALAPRVLGGRAQEHQVLLEDVFDPEEDVSESRFAHQRRQAVAAIGDRRCHRLDDVMNVVEPGVDDRPAQGLEPLDIQRDVVVDNEDGARSPRPCVGDVGEDAREVERVEIPSAHLDDRAEAAIVRYSRARSPRCRSAGRETCSPSAFGRRGPAMPAIRPRSA